MYFNINTLYEQIKEYGQPVRTDRKRGIIEECYYMDDATLIFVELDPSNNNRVDKIIMM